jgi:hypothetical protein
MSWFLDERMLLYLKATQRNDSLLQQHICTTKRPKTKNIFKKVSQSMPPVRYISIGHKKQR